MRLNMANIGKSECLIPKTLFISSSSFNYTIISRQIYPYSEGKKGQKRDKNLLAENARFCALLKNSTIVCTPTLSQVNKLKDCSIVLPIIGV